MALDGLEVLVGEVAGGGSAAPQSSGSWVVDALVLRQDAIRLGQGRSHLPMPSPGVAIFSVAGSIFPARGPRRGIVPPWAVFQVTSPIDEAGAGRAHALPSPGSVGQSDPHPRAKKSQQRRSTCPAGDRSSSTRWNRCTQPVT